MLSWKTNNSRLTTKGCKIELYVLSSIQECKNCHNRWGFPSWSVTHLRLHAVSSESSTRNVAVIRHGIMWLINKENKDTFNMSIYIMPAWKKQVLHLSSQNTFSWEEDREGIDSINCYNAGFYVNFTQSEYCKKLFPSTKYSSSVIQSVVILTCARLQLKEKFYFQRNKDYIAW